MPTPGYIFSFADGGDGLMMWCSSHGRDMWLYKDMVQEFLVVTCLCCAEVQTEPQETLGLFLRSQH